MPTSISTNNLLGVRHFFIRDPFQLHSERGFVRETLARRKEWSPLRSGTFSRGLARLADRRPSKYKNWLHADCSTTAFDTTQRDAMLHLPGTNPTSLPEPQSPMHSAEQGICSTRRHVLSISRLLCVLISLGFLGCSPRSISPSWASMSFDIDTPGAMPNRTWSGFADYGTPIQIDERTVAIIERRPGVEFALWHLDFVDGAIKFILVVNPGRESPSGYDEVVWHRIESDIIGEFIRIRTVEFRPNRHLGESLIGEINIRTGATVTKADKINHVNSEKVAIEKLLDKRRSRDTVFDPPDAEEVMRKVQKALAKKNLSFDFHRGRFVLSADARQRLQRDVRNLVSNSAGISAEAIRGLRSRLSELPSCPATRQLAAELEAFSAALP